VEALTKLANVAAVALQNARLYDQAERLAASEERQRSPRDARWAGPDVELYQADRRPGCSRDGDGPSGSGDGHPGADQFRFRPDDRGYPTGNRQPAGARPLDENLQEQLASLAEEFSQDGPPVKWTSSVTIPLVLARQESQQVLHVAREALLNAQKHSQAACISLRLSQAADEYVLMVEDGGVD